MVAIWAQDRELVQKERYELQPEVSGIWMSVEPVHDVRLNTLWSFASQEDLERDIALG